MGRRESIEDEALELARGCAAGVVAPEWLAAWIVARVAASPIRRGPIEIDPVARAVRREGRPIALRHREYALLHHLAQCDGEPQSRDALLRAIWGLAFDPGTNIVAVHMSRLRAAIDQGAPRPLIETVRGRGYRLAT